MKRFLIALMIALTPVRAWGTNDTARYLLKFTYGNGYIWQWSEDFPLVVSETMCWDSQAGFACDNRFEGGRQIATVIDFEQYRHGGIYRQDNGLCYLWFWMPAIGEDGNPHVAEAFWIVCPS